MWRGIFATVWRPPSFGDIFWDYLQENYEEVVARNDLPIIILGDLNADPQTHQGTCLAEFSEQNNLATLIREPTRVTCRSATILDQILTNKNLSQFETPLQEQ